MKVGFTRNRTIEFSQDCKKNFLITMKAPVFAVQKHSLQRRGECRLHLGPMPEFLLVNSTTRRFSMAIGFERKKIIKISLFAACSLTIFGLVVQVYELLTCVQQTNKNTRKLISVVQFLFALTSRNSTLLSGKTFSTKHLTSHPHMTTSPWTNGTS